MHLLVLAQAAFLMGNPSQAGPTEAWCGKSPAEPVVVDTDRCSLDGRTLRISLTSPTGCWSEDDMTLVLETAGRAANVRWPGEFPTRWWMLDPVDPTLHKWTIGPLCGRADAVPVGREQVLFLLRTSGRPNADRLVAVLYDTRRAAVLDLEDVGTVGDLVGRDEHGVWVREAEWSQEAGSLIGSDEESLLLPDGDRLTEARRTETSLNPVIRVRVAASEVRSDLDMERTFTRFKRFFADARAFEAAVRRNADPRHLLVREGRTARGRACIQIYGSEASASWGSLPWHCETK